MLKRTVVQCALQVSALALMALTAACGTSIANPTGSATDATSNATAVVTPTPAPTTTPTPTPAANTPAPTALGEAAVADNFDGTPGLEPEQGPALVSIDAVGAFRMMCTAGQLLRDDPLVSPGQPGASHLHQFFGNTGTNAGSGYQSLRTSGGTTCGQASTPFNRSAYWFPAMLDGVGHVVKPDFIKLYYKRNPLSDPMCSPTSAQHLGQCVTLPNGIRYVFGYNMKTGEPFVPGSVFFTCQPSEDGTVSNSPATGRYTSLAEVAAAGCPVGAQLVIAASSPNCWDGVNLDTADHRSHMSYATGPYYSGQMFNACPADHPYVVPNMEVLLQFTVDANLATWHVSSDEMVAGAAKGSTFHMDYWEAWSPIKATWEADCLDKHMSCNNGGLGDGTEIKGAGVPWPGGFPKHQLVSVP